MNMSNELEKHLVQTICETNGINLHDTLELAIQGANNLEIKDKLIDFLNILNAFQIDQSQIESLHQHDVGHALFNFFKNFPLPYREEHIHLTGSLSAEFVFPKLKKLLDGENSEIYVSKIKEVYPNFDKLDLQSVDDLMRLKEDEQFDRYLKILILPKLILTDRETHKEAAYHMAKDLYEKFNVGFIRLKFTLSRLTTNQSESIPGIEHLTPEDVVLGLFEGFKEFQKEVSEFNFILSPSFRKEADHFDSTKFKNKKDHIIDQVNTILDLIEKYPALKNHLTDVDTVGNERNLYKKTHFNDMKQGLRRLHYKGFSIRSHHGETWKTLRLGVQAVDNSMNIWHINTLEHGVSLGINPNIYFHSLYLRVLEQNQKSIPLKENTLDFNEVTEMDWTAHPEILSKIIEGAPLDSDEKIKFVKVKFHTAREVEHYQHDVLNRMIHKEVSLIALPSSNKKLTGILSDYKDHPFSWWEKKGVKLGIGTDNYITLNTNYIKELLIVLFTDAMTLKITKLLMVATGEKRRPLISQLLWQMRN